MKNTEQLLAEAVDILSLLVTGSEDLEEIVTDTINGLPCEKEYRSKLTGKVVGYWAYGNYDQEMPYIGFERPYITGRIAFVIKQFLRGVK